MKKHKILIPVLLVFAFILVSCEAELNNVITVRNLSQSDLTINFRGNHYEIPSGEFKATVSDIKDIPKGTYAYTTIYGVPSGAGTYSAEGDLSGEIEFKQGTHALIIYTSALMDSSYTIFATLTTNEDLGDTEGVTQP